MPKSLVLNPQGPGAHKRILYFTDKLGVSDGYTKVFNHTLGKAGIRRGQVTLTSIYHLVPKALIKKGNRIAPGFNPDCIDEITQAVEQRIEALKPDLIVVSCPAVLGLLTGWDWNVATLDKCRGGVYDLAGIPAVVVLPISAVNTHVDERALRDDDDEEVKAEPYRIKQGAWIVQRDWEKVGRYVHDRQLRLPKFEYSICRTIRDCKAAKDWLADCAIISTDVETGCFPAQITCIGFTGLTVDGRCRSFVIPFYDPFTAEGQPSGCFWPSIDDHQLAWSITGDILNNPVPKTMQNGTYDASYFIKYRLGLNNWRHDSMFMWFSLYMELPKTLDFISSILLDNYQYWKDDIKGIEQDDRELGKLGLEKYWRYNALDCYNTLWNTLRLCILLDVNESMQRSYRDTWMRVVSALRMSMRGMRADQERRTFHRDELIAEQARAVERFRFLIDDPTFNINSPAQKADLFYRVLGCRERTARGRFFNPNKPKSKMNSVSTGKIALKMVKTEHPYFKFLVEAMESAMEPDKQLSNVFGRYDEDGRVKGGIKFFTPRFRTAFNPVGTTSTRYSSKSSNFWDGTNAQNIREIYRDWLVADPDCVIMDVDYSQSDDVFVGYEANDANKIAVIESGVDGHAVHGELFFKIPYDEIVSGKKSHDPRIIHPVTGIRQIAKRVVHGTNFQMAGLTLFMTMGREAVVAAAKLLGFKDAETWPQDRLVKVCDYLMSQYRKRYPRISRKEWYSEIAQDLRTKGTITNAFNITRRFLADPSDSGTQREATGFIGQSDTAGNMNRTQYEIDHGWMPESFRDGLNPDRHDQPRQMDWFSHGFQFLLQVHDSFIVQLNTKNPRWKEAAANLLHVMRRPIIINGHHVRVKVEAQLGRRWHKDEMVEWKSGDPMDLDRLVRGVL